MELGRCREKLHDVDFYKARMEVRVRRGVGLGHKSCPGGAGATRLLQPALSLLPSLSTPPQGPP